jgi:hypothetical protein
MDFGAANGGDFATAKSPCAQRILPFGFTRLIDISDARKPVTARRIVLHVHDPAYCRHNRNHL